MGMVETVPEAAAEAQGPPRRSWRRRGVAAAVVVVLVAWWLLTIPRLGGGFIVGVSSADHEVVTARGLREDVYVIPSFGPGSATVAFGLSNHGLLPVEIVDVWPEHDEPMCWRPSERQLEVEPAAGDLDRLPSAIGAVLPPGEGAVVWITGAHDPDTCGSHVSLRSVDEVEVVVRIAGRTSTRQVPLGFIFGFAEDPTMLHDFYELDVVTPEPPA
ncbi:hypothetical protein FTX61_16770 [Nitriliruptoraceae bacterium ZYF776]|nr:hypothetical protein [Profundirhabdus halotolerans]